MKTKWYVLSTVAFILGIVFSVSVAFQPGKGDGPDNPIKETIDPPQKSEVKAKSTFKQIKWDSATISILPDSVINKLKQEDSLIEDVKTTTIITESKTKDVKATNKSFLREVVIMEGIAQKAPFVAPLPSKVAATPQMSYPDTIRIIEERKPKKIFKRLKKIFKWD